MFISLQQLEQRAVPFEVSVPAGTIEFDGKLQQASDLRAQGKAELISVSLGEIRVQGRVAVTVTSPCDRCLEPAVVEVNRTFDLVYLPEAEGRVGGREELEEGAVEVGYYDGPGLELNDALREVVLLATPMRIVCSEDCHGICPVCGQNRNQRECDCRSQPMDDRWSKLRSLKV